MAVGKKGLRKVKAHGKLFYWHVKDTEIGVPEQGFVSDPASRRILHIISADKRFIVHYCIPQADDAHAELYVEGPYFPRAPGQKEIEVPRWRHDGKRYPTADFVRRLIDYCLEEAVS
jgi:hypothetical protein